MRVLFLLLLLANLLFFYWARWVAPPPAVAGHVLPDSREPGGIRLIRELPTDARSAEAGGDIRQQFEAGPACVSIGPFAERLEADLAGARLTELGFSWTLREATDSLRVGQWLRVAGQATASDAANTVAALQDQGLEDMVVMNDADGDLVVSLGVFAEPERAAEAAGKARSAGFRPIATDRYADTRVHWLDVDREANAGLPSLDDLAIGGPLGDSLEMRACPVADESQSNVDDGTPLPPGDG
ncbi:MAG TPA: hypothetical protein VLM41_10450 [Steroidobacteraceae bacterium]|nr:hypothetical protein [Steroidobacteraceae bacterium]